MTELDEKTYPTLTVATAMSGIGLGPCKFSDIHEIYSRVLGVSVWTHEIAGPIGKEAQGRLYKLFPLMPTRERAEADWQTAAQTARAAYGETVVLRRGAGYERPAGPVETLREMVSDDKIVVVET